jgi:hypothetical protein
MNGEEYRLEEVCCESQRFSYRCLSSKKQYTLFFVLQRAREDFHYNVFIYFLTQRNSRGLISLQQCVGAEHSLWGPELFDMPGSDSSKARLLKFARMVVTRRI